MIIREYSEKDIDEITRLMKTLCAIKGQVFDEERWRTSLETHMKENKISDVIVAFNADTEQVIGMAQCQVRHSKQGLKFGYISNLIVQEEKRRSGVGEALMRQSVDFFKRNHIESVRLALKSNLDEAAELLFKKLGFDELVRIYELKI